RACPPTCLFCALDGTAELLSDGISAFGWVRLASHASCREFIPHGFQGHRSHKRCVRCAMDSNFSAGIYHRRVERFPEWPVRLAHLRTPLWISPVDVEVQNQARNRRAILTGTNRNRLRLDGGNRSFRGVA